MSKLTEKSDLVITIRPMRPADLPVLMALEQICFSDPWPRDAFESVFEEANWHGIVALHQKEIIAYACWLMGVGELHLANIAVHPDYRRKSVARRLLRRILYHARQSGCEMILLEVRPSNTAARLFYEREGFTVMYERPGYYQHPREKALVMVRRLQTDGDE